MLNFIYNHLTWPSSLVFTIINMPRPEVQLFFPLKIPTQPSEFAQKYYFYIKYNYSHQLKINFLPKTKVILNTFTVTICPCHSNKSHVRVTIQFFFFLFLLYNHPFSAHARTNKLQFFAIHIIISSAPILAPSHMSHVMESRPKTKVIPSFCINHQFRAHVTVTIHIHNSVFSFFFFVNS